ncbi:MAG: hypothetical protein GC164_11820 [Phycisphaera sp.]|nr:hypothetical protein [Phycisphaera sp.]
MKLRMYWVHSVCAVALAAAWNLCPALPVMAAQADSVASTHGTGDRYAQMLSQLKAEIERALPKVDAQKIAAYDQARKAEEAAEKRVEQAQSAFGEINKARGLIGHANWWIGDAKKNVAKAQDALKKAKTDAERQAAKKTIDEQTQRMHDGEEALKERQAALDKAEKNEPKLTGELNAAKDALAKAKASTLSAFDALGLNAFLAGDSLDTKLIKFEVLFGGTPQGFSEFAQQGEAQRQLIEKLLSDNDLMKQMVMADGPTGGNYGKAMEIYTAIQHASPKAGEGVLQRLALAIALEHAQPIKQGNAKNDVDAPAIIDPVKRYLAYEKAYLNSELDPAFKDLSTWDLRFVVDGDEPDETLAWGREMLRNYRPDHITNNDYKWRYVGSVASEIRYGSDDNKYDQPDLQNYQNILKNGGVCGRRAFFGRFILRAFGIPTTARPQSGHAALVHWTPDGWVVNLGAGWGSGWTKTRYKDDLDFLATTQARADMAAYIQVKRAQWIGDVKGEKPVFGFNEKAQPGFWYGVSLSKQREIIQHTKTLAAAGEELGESNSSDIGAAGSDQTISEADRKITVDSHGVITIPAAACSDPVKSTGKIIFMPSDAGGMQLHYSRNGGGSFEYTLDAPAAGRYALVAKVVTPSWQQHLMLTVNGANPPIDIELPFTVGMWGQTQPAVVELVKGKNVLSFTRRSDGQAKGFSISHFTLTPVK